MNEKTKINICNIILMLLLYTGCFMLISAVIYSLTPNSDKWFTRVSIGLILLGLSAIIIKLDKLK